MRNYCTTSICSKFASVVKSLGIKIGWEAVGGGGKERNTGVDSSIARVQCLKKP